MEVRSQYRKTSPERTAGIKRAIKDWLRDDNVLEHRMCILDPEYIGEVPFDIKERKRDSRGGSYRRRIIHCQAVAHSFAARKRRKCRREARSKLPLILAVEAEDKKRRARTADRAELGGEEKTESVLGKIARRRQATRDADTSFSINQE